MRSYCNLRLGSIAVLVGLIGILLGACSGPQLAYRNADWLLTRYADGYLDLESAQRERWQPILQAALERHRGNELPLISAFLGRVAHAVEAGLSPSGLVCLRAELGPLLQRNARLLAEASAPLLASLDARQTDYLETRLDEANAEYRENYLAPEPVQRREDRVGRVIERIERWTGRLDADQERLVKARVATWPDLAAPWYTYRFERQRGLLQLLRADADAVAIERFLSDWWVDMQPPSSDLELARDRVLSAIIRLLVDLDGTLTGKQRERAVQRLQELAEDLQRLTPYPTRNPVRQLAGAECASVDALADTVAHHLHAKRVERGR